MTEVEPDAHGLLEAFHGRVFRKVIAGRRTPNSVSPYAVRPSDFEHQLITQALSGRY
jgi:hypothetical protein